MLSSLFDNSNGVEKLAPSFISFAQTNSSIVLRKELSFIMNKLQNVLMGSRTEKQFSDTIGVCVLSAGGGHVAEK